MSSSVAKDASPATLSTASAKSTNATPGVSASKSSSGKSPAEFNADPYLEEASNLLDKIRNTAGNVTTGQSQIDQTFSRAGSLVEALRADSSKLDEEKLKESVEQLEETFKNMHKHVLRFAIYGKAKAFINRTEISQYFESLNIQMDSVLKNFAITRHRDLEEWETDYYQAKLEDESAANEQLWEIVNSESDMKVIEETGDDARQSLKSACEAAMADPHAEQERKKMLKLFIARIDTPRTGLPIPDVQALALNESYRPKGNPPPITPIGTPGASSSSSNIKARVMVENVPGESAGAKAKREEAEMERLRALSGQDGEYEETPLPRWEPRRPPPGRGPGSIDETTAASSGITIDTSANKKLDTVPDEPPPSYS